MQGKNVATIFGVQIDSPDDLLTKIDKILSTRGSLCRISTLNPEILLLSRNDDRYKKILNSAAINIVDGSGIVFVLWLHGLHNVLRYTGTDLMHDILDIIDKHEGSVFLAVHKDGLSSWIEVKNVLEALYPRIAFYGGDIDPNTDMERVIKEISCDVVLCNFGAPEQEFFLASIDRQRARIGVGVGGAFDYATGVIQRAPRWMRRIGLEWFYRLIQQPHRIKRIMRAVCIFPYLALKNVKINK